jgi:hypothetical protein
MDFRRIVQDIFLYFNLDFPWEITQNRIYYDRQTMGPIEYSDFVQWIE